MSNYLSPCLLALCLLAPTAFAASIYKKALDKKTDQYLTEGVVVGGQSGSGFTLLNIRRSFSKGVNTERFVFDMGDRDGKPLINRLNFYHVNIEGKIPRLVIDLAQVQRSALDANAIQKIFARSMLVKKAEINFDPLDQTTSLVLDLKKPSQAEVFEMPSPDKPSRIVIDVKPLAVTKIKKAKG